MGATTLSPQDLQAIKQFNDNVEWLRKNKVTPIDTIQDEWLTVIQAEKILDRRRTWIQTRMIAPEDVKQPMNVNWFFIRGLDWKREGSKLMFKRSSIERMKNESLPQMGMLYDIEKKKRKTA